MILIVIDMSLISIFWGVINGTAMRPRGLPCRTMLQGLPGNPVSCFVTFKLLAAPALLRLRGLPLGLAEMLQIRTRGLHEMEDLLFIYIYLYTYIYNTVNINNIYRHTIYLFNYICNVFTIDKYLLILER